jgi:hypothetical protein
MPTPEMTNDLRKPCTSLGLVRELTRRNVSTEVGENDSKKYESDAPGVSEKRALSGIQVRKIRNKTLDAFVTTC